MMKHYNAENYSGINRLLAEQRIKRVETAYSFNFFV